MSNDSEQEYFCDGVVEDIITEISKFRWLSVIARHSSFSYKGTSTNIKTVGLELGARYVVEGSIRKAGNRIRINAQLIDSTDDSHVWAEKYDRELTDIFELQDEIAQTLVATIEPELSASELRRARRKPTGNLDAWELVHRAFSHIYQYKSEDFEAAEQLLNDAIALDPEFASAHAVKGYSIYVRTIMGFAKYPKESIELAKSCVTKAIALDDRDAFAFRALGTIQYLQYDYEESLKNLDYAIKLNPNFAQAYISKALAMMLAGNKDSEETRVTARTGMRLSPKDPMTWQAMNVIGGTHLFDGELDEAAEILKTACSLPVTNYYPFLYLAITLELMGQDGEAKSAMASAKILGPSLTIAKHNRQMGRPVVSRLEAIGAIQAMRELGLPDG
jgi:TolB-like protein/lipoprotein NlpI